MKRESQIFKTRPKEDPEKHFRILLLIGFFEGSDRNLAEIFLKDFLLSLITLATKSERFRIFSELSNIDWNNGTSDQIQVISNMNKFNKNVV